MARMLFAAAFIAMSVTSAAVAGPIVKVTYTGTVSGTDYSGLFGNAGANLNGMSFVASYQFDPGLGYHYSNSTESYAYGGSLYGATSPSLSATLTINGHSFSMAGNYYGSIAAYEQPGFSEQYSVAESNDGVTDITLYNYVYDYSKQSFGTPTFNVSSDTTGFYSTYGIFQLSSANEYNTLYLANAHVTVSVPEPASWALMVGGFGMAGGAMRSRRRAAIRVG